MTIADLIPRRHIRLALAAKNRWETIEELLDVLSSGGDLDAVLRERALSAVLERERSMSTGIGEAIAIPHATVDGIPDVLAVFGRSVGGIEFDALDARPVKLVVLFLVPLGQLGNHLNALATIAKFLNRPAIRSQLLQAPDEDRIAAVFATALDEI